MKKISSDLIKSKNIVLCGFTQHFFIFLLFLLIHQVSYAQFLTIPVPQNQSTSLQKSQASSRINALTLPFFDDFSTAKNGQAIPSLWQTNGGVFVNNTLAVNQPTVNVATFDGLQANGFPYDFTNQLTQGATDTLTSLPINLSVHTPADSLYFSFFWQGKGLGEQPDLSDSLQLQFLTNGNIWNTVWVQKGVNLPVNFSQVILLIRASLYFHGNFQFRFQSFGRKSGQFDVWNLDYVCLAKKSDNSVNGYILGSVLNNQTNKFERVSYLKDIACSDNIEPVLKRYRSMPLVQFLAGKPSPSAEINDSTGVKVNNLYSNNNDVNIYYSVRNTNLSAGNDTLQKDQRVGRDALSVGASKVFKFKNNFASKITGDKAYLNFKFLLGTQDASNISFKNSILAQNDTISTTVALDNFYAYDDGTAETGAYLKKGFGRVAVQFVNNKADVVKAIRINLQPSLTNIVGNAITLQVMGNDHGKPGQILRGLYTKVQYSDVQNGFIEYAIDPVAVTDTFYVGYLQLTDDEPIIVGLDKNSPQFTNKHFFNISNSWTNVANADTSIYKAIRGSMMIRPVMGGKPLDVVLENETEIQDENLIVSPNPSPDIIHWNDSSLKNVEVLDVYGRSILKENTDSQSINLQHLNSGMYLLRLSNERNTFVRKIWISH
ncbi:T9SS type A sorting domain-containing protein [Arcicella lustrica]|uniref:T9SS type A sorting domain-containing protein n=1 Tax=Arcicella lustrica TaxID=2984196 RepID=A0ABU5SNM0_9BACT|nr:T9SS type A sorting domain-containing protein [Arcicella sp. DC25W]MEA5428860.1 T9SS type A sorting domain-containing protein [Arcicella sp. DC25W]